MSSNNGSTFTDDYQEISQSNGGDSNNPGARESASKIVIGNRENSQLWKVRGLLVLVLVLVAAGVSTAVFVFSRESEKNDFETQYYDHAHKVTSAFQANAKRRLTAIESFAVSIASGAKARGEHWPEVAVLDYERQAEYVIELAEVISLLWLPLVTPETRAGWEAFSRNNTSWIDASLAYQEQRKPENFDVEKDAVALEYLSLLAGGPLPEGQSYNHEIYNLTGPGTIARAKEDAPYYFPWWQTAPISPGSVRGINYNIVTHPTRTAPLAAVVKTQKPLVTTAWDYSDDDHPHTRGKQLVLDLYLQRWNQGTTTYESGPLSDLYYPIFEAYEDENYQEIPADQRKMVAVITCFVYWQIYFENVLPDADNAQGVIAVLENSCQQAFTYVMHGSSATYLGAGDLHDPKYNKYVVETGYGAFLGFILTRFEEQECIYNVRIYPSQELEDSFMTNSPMIFTIVVVCVFVATSLIFLLYDCLVEKRQRVVMQKAVQSTEVVNTLFPETVRDRLFDEGNNKRSRNDEFVAQEGPRDNKAGEIVADLYENCTILFADLAGFISSSQQQVGAQ